MGEPQLLSFYLVIIIAAGVTAQLLGKLLRLPSIVFLLAFGVLLGPEVAGAIQPDLFGPGLQIMITLTVVIVLFEGSMNLHVREILHVHKSVRGLVTIGFAVTWGSATLLLHFLMGVAWAPAALFGALVSSTGPTVIKPLMQVIPVRREIRTILDAEGILADPISILAAVLCLEIAVAGGIHVDQIGAAIGLGAVVGAIIGWLMGYLIPARLGRVEALKNLLVLSCVFVAYGIAEYLQPEAGVVAVIAAGLAIQHGVRPHQHELRDFHEQISTLLLSVLFIVLAAGLKMDVMTGVGWKGLTVVLVLMFIVRPLNIFMSTRGGKAKLREKIFMSWTCPRGIVAAALASLAALELSDAGMEKAGLTVQAMVFLTIFLTVFGQGLTAKPLAWLLRIHAADHGDVIVVGASPLARALARPFRDANRRVVMLDLNPRRVDVAKSEGFEILCEDGSNRDALKEAGIEEADTMIAATENSHVNVVAAQLGKREFNLKNVAVLLDEKEFSEMDPVLERAGVWLATGRPTNQQIWNRDLAEHKARIEEVTVTEHNRPAEKLADVNFHSSVLPLSVVRKGQVLICTQSMTLEEGDRIWLAVRGVEREVLQRDLGIAHPEQ